MLCEGHNSRAQDYLRNQDEHALGRKAKKKINLVSEVVHFFREASSLTAMLLPSLLTLLTYLTDLLTYLLATDCLLLTAYC